MSFTVRFALVLIAGVLAAIVISPLVAVAVASAGYRFPFPRIFDRTAMATILLAILCSNRQLRLTERLAGGFSEPRRNLARALRGFLIAAAALVALWLLALALGGRAASAAPGVFIGLPRDLAAAIVIAAIEEGFFRAFLLDGMKSDIGARGAVAASSVVYALAHLVRSPARFYVTGLAPLAGASTLAGAMAQLTDPHAAPPALGLFLIGLVLGEGFVLTSTVYFSLGIHAGLITGLRVWRRTLADRAVLAGWIFGYGRFPLVSGAAGWAAALIILALTRPLSRGR